MVKNLYLWQTVLLCRFNILVKDFFPCQIHLDHQLLLRGHLHNGLYHLHNPPDVKPAALHTAPNMTSLWHAHLGHPNSRRLSSIAKTLSISFPSSSNFLCKSCNVAKSHKLKFNKRTSATTSSFEIIHSDVWGPAPEQSLNGFRYYVIFTDDFTRFSWIYFMHTKQETFSNFKTLCSYIHTQFNKTPKTLQTDGGGEYMSAAFKSYLQEHGIQHHVSCPHTPEQNGIAERKHRHVLKLTRAILHASNLPAKFWSDAIGTSIHLINRLPRKNYPHLSPYQLLYNKEPNYSYLRVFGCLCYPWLRPNAAHKLAPRSQECIFLGYSSQHKGYKCYNLHTHKTIMSRHVVFWEQEFPYHTSAHSLDTTSPPYIPPSILVPTSLVQRTNSQASTKSTPLSRNPAPLADIPQAIPVSTTTTSRTTPTPPTVPARPHHSMQTRSKSGIIKPNPLYSLYSNQNLSHTPENYNQARHIPHWQEAMKTEFQALQQQKTWSLVPAPPGKHILGCKWTFKTKILPSGQVDRYKARLVALGYNQKQGENYNETFSPVAKMTTIRVLLTVALNQNWKILQLDVSNAFLHGDLPEDIFMRQPQGFVDPQFPNSVCKLHKSLYGLKQAPRQWFQKLTDFLQSRGFRFSRSDPSLLLFSQNGINIFFLIYVDDLLVTGNDQTLIQTLLTDIRSTFALKNLGEISLFLGIQVSKTSQGYFLSQTHYASKLLQDAGFTDCKSSPTPITPNSKEQLTNNQPFTDPSLYRRLAGSLQYLTITRPDIAFATNRVCQQMQQPSVQDFQALQRILRYIKGTLSYGLPLIAGPLQLQTFADADWASDHMDRKSTSGFCSFIGPNLVSWTVKKQATVAKSSTEAEYHSLSAASSDVIWLRRLLSELYATQQSPTPLHCDNISAIALAKNPVFHARTKHIEIDYHFIRQHINNDNLIIKHISSKEQVADILTKPFSTARFHELRSKLTIQNQND
ncbi:Retrovirus-related Pol polyprotein from transposon TNT 1-94 [Dendrobium catenatum]|uniref:Retrovirus-related Pol polyprotein from transposon TNT 1-94 n=1 Tax=Dendrobium catenatum TaxID=906689 RepID=A0A2I0WBB8_9ASPA|nr:Retrovirus-related Pol polyprotein from transposon TNT 1-94 [Dendrobium catenatum]